MSPKVSTAALSMPLNCLDDVRPRMARAELASQSSSMALTAVVKDALIRHYGSLKAAAITMRMDQAQLTRELQTGDFKLKKLEGDSEALAFIATAMHESFSKIKDPKARGRRLHREVLERLKELEQLLEYAS